MLIQVYPGDLDDGREDSTKYCPSTSQTREGEQMFTKIFLVDLLLRVPNMNYCEYPP